MTNTYFKREPLGDGKWIYAAVLEGKIIKLGVASSSADASNAAESALRLAKRGY